MPATCRPCQLALLDKRARSQGVYHGGGTAHCIRGRAAQGNAVPKQSGYDSRIFKKRTRVEHDGTKRERSEEGRLNLSDLVQFLTKNRPRKSSVGREKKGHRAESGSSLRSRSSHTIAGRNGETKKINAALKDRPRDWGRTKNLQYKDKRTYQPARDRCTGAQSQHC